LTDDLAAREAAKQLRLSPVGSLGLVARAYRRGYVSLSQAERHMTDLYDLSSLFVSKAIVEMAVEQLRNRARRR
jgi:predicted nucleic acid-binding protein